MDLNYNETDGLGNTKILQLNFYVDRNGRLYIVEYISGGKCYGAKYDSLDSRNELKYRIMDDVERQVVSALDAVVPEDWGKGSDT